MPYSDIYLYSPLSNKTVKDGKNRTLLLQFLLSEMLHCAGGDKKEDPLEFVFSSPACFFPYDWSDEVGCLNKIEEHARLLPDAFPHMLEEIDAFEKTLSQILEEVIIEKKKRKDIAVEDLLLSLQNLFFKLKPFLIACNECENLAYFLVKNSDEVGQLAQPETVSSLLEEMFPEKNASEFIAASYENRGFHHCTL